MKILRILETVIAARGLEVLLLGKEVATFNDANLGIVTAIKKELSQDNIWMVINNLGQENLIPIEQIASVAKKIILFGDLSIYDMARNRDMETSSG